MKPRDMIYGPMRWLLVQCGKLVETLRPGPPAAKLNLFFATPAVGGAERIHARIVEVLADRKPEVFFTEPAPNRGLLQLYTAVAKVTDLSPSLGGRAGFYLTVGRLAARLNRTGGVVMGAFSYFFYRMLPYLGPNVRCVDLLHNFGIGFEHFSLPFVPRLDRRVVITAAVAEKLQTLYADHGLPKALAARIALVENAVDVPAQMPRKNFACPLRVLYVGRTTPEKRVYLAGRLAAACAHERMATRFIFVGDVAGALAPQDARFVRRAGIVTNARKLARLYELAHVLVLTSEREGFSVAVMEGMARGVTPLCTDVGGMSSHVIDGLTGALVPAAPDDAVVAAMLERLRCWSQDKDELARLGAGAYERAAAHFSPQRFARMWREVLSPPGEPQPAPATAAAGVSSA